MTSTPITVIDEGTARDLAADADGEDLWVGASALAASAWEYKPAGLCRGELCVPVPARRDAELVRADGAVNLAALARRRGQPVVHDDARTLWLFDQPGSTQHHLRASLAAPDFVLPDLDGHLHTLAAERGKKVLLVSWASW